MLSELFNKICNRQFFFLPFMNPTLPISIIITTWNSEAVILRCLESLKGQDAHDIHIIDNGSSDRTLEIIEQADLAFSLHHEEENREIKRFDIQGKTWRRDFGN